MADILNHPNFDVKEQQTWKSPCGASVTLQSGTGRPITVAEAIYLLEDVKFQIFMMMHADE